MTPEQRELKTCPFCGGAARIESNRDWHRLYADHDEDCALYDANDLLMFPAQPGYLKEIADLWDRRAQVEALTVPQVAVSVERGGVYIIKGVQSFRLAYEGETRGEQEWYAGVLRKALAAPTIPAIPGTKEGA